MSENISTLPFYNHLVHLLCLGLGKRLDKMKGTPLLTATPLQCRPVVVELYLAKLDCIVASLVLNSSRSVAAASICGSLNKEV